MGLWRTNPKKDIQKMHEIIMAAKGEELSVLEFMETATKEKDKFIAAIPHKTPTQLNAYAGYLMEIIEFQQKDINGIIKETRYLERRARSRALSGSSTDQKVISLFQDLMNKVRELEKTLEQQYGALAINHHKVFIGHREEEKNISIAFSQIVHGLEAVIPELERVELTEKNYRSLGYAMSSLFTGIVIGSFLTVGIPTSAWAATGSSPTDTVNKGLGALELYLHKLSEIEGKLPPGTIAIALGGLGALMIILDLWQKNNSKKMERKALVEKKKRETEEGAKEKELDEAITRDLEAIKRDFPTSIQSVTITEKNVTIEYVHGDDRNRVHAYITKRKKMGEKVSFKDSQRAVQSYFKVNKDSSFVNKEKYIIPKYYGKGTILVNVVPIIEEDESGNKSYYWAIFGEYHLVNLYSNNQLDIKRARNVKEAVAVIEKVLNLLTREFINLSDQFLLSRTNS